jgi:hypothetical protein
MLEIRADHTLNQGVTYETFAPFQCTRQTRTEVHWTVQDFGEESEVAYQLELPPQLSDVHDVFHVSQLMKCLCVPKVQIPMEDLDAKEDLSYQEYPIKRVTQNKKIKMCKVQWSHHTVEEATREREEELKAEFPCFFSDPSESRGGDSF